MKQEETRRHRAARDAAVGWITEVLTAKRWRGTDLARNAKLAPSTVLRIMNDPKHRYVPSLNTLREISRASGHEIPSEVLKAIGEAHFERSGLAPSEDTEGVRRPGATTAGGSSPTVRLSSVSTLPSALRGQMEELRSAPRPPQLANDTTAYAFHMPDRGLEPWVKSGSLLYATKRSDPVVGDIVLVTDGQGRSRVRLLNEMDQLALRLRGASDADEETLNFTDIKDISVVAVIVAR